MDVRHPGAIGGVVFTVSKKELDAVVFDAIVSKVTTLTDGGIRITFDLPEHAIPQASRLMDYKRTEQPLRVACAVSDTDGA